MARLPQPGGDTGNWGEILNEYLLEAHGADGTLKDIGILAEKYVKPIGGIPSSDLASSVQTSLANGDQAPSKYTKPGGGIPKSDLASDVQASLTSADGVGDKYTKPGSGIPKTDLEASVQNSLDSADQVAFNAKSYGAIGNGTADDTAAIQAAIDAAAVSGGRVYLPAGRYKLTTALVPKAKVAIYGAGPGKSVLLPTGEICAIRGFGGYGAPIYDMAFEDFEIDGANQSLAGAYSSSTVKGIYIEWMKRVIFRNLYIHHTGATGLGVDFIQEGLIENVVVTNCGRLNDGTQPGGSGIGVGLGGLDVNQENLVIAHCHARDNKRFGIFVESQDPASNCVGNTIIACWASGNQIGIGESGGLGTRIVACHTYQNSVAGISIDCGTYANGKPGTDTTIALCEVYNNTTWGIRVEETNSRDVLGLRITGNNIHSNPSGGIKLNPKENSPTFNRVKVDNNDIHNNGGNGIHCKYAFGSGPVYKSLTITGNRIWNNGTSGGSERFGIALYCNITDGLISNNECWDDQASKTQQEGIHAPSGWTYTNLDIIGNNLRRNSLAAINLAGTLSAVRVIDNAGHNPQGIATVTVGGSPFTYTAGTTPEILYISGGSGVSVTKSSQGLGAPSAVQLASNEQVTIAYSSAPTVVKDRR